MFQGNAEILAGSRPEQGTGETGAVEGGRPPTGRGPVRPERLRQDALICDELSRLSLVSVLINENIYRSEVCTS